MKEQKDFSLTEQISLFNETQELERKQFFLELTKAWQQFIMKKLEEENFVYLLEFTDEAFDFMKNFKIENLQWTQNYHWGINANFRMDVVYREKPHQIEGAWRLYAFPYKGEEYAYFQSAKADELFANLLFEFGLEEYLLQIDGHNWSPESDEPYEEIQEEVTSMSQSVFSDVKESELPF